MAVVRELYPSRFAGWFALAVFALFSVLPIWTAWYIGSWEATGKLTSFWAMLISFPPATEQGRAERLVELYGPEAIQFAVLVGTSLGVGRLLAGRSKQGAG